VTDEKNNNSCYKTWPAALPSRVPVGRFRPMCAVLLSIIVQCVNNGGGRCGVRPVGDDAWRECCRSDRQPVQAWKNFRIDWLIDCMNSCFCIQWNIFCFTLYHLLLCSSVVLYVDRYRLFENLFDMPTSIVCAHAIDSLDKQVCLFKSRVYSVWLFRIFVLRTRWIIDKDVSWFSWAMRLPNHSVEGEDREGLKERGGLEYYSWWI